MVDPELQQLHVDIAVLQETRLPDSGTLKEENYTFFWQGINDDHTSYHGVGFTVKNSIVNNISTPVGRFERLMTMRLASTDGHVNFVCAYAPTLASAADDKDGFYGELRTILEELPVRKKLVFCAILMLESTRTTKVGLVFESLGWEI